MLDDHVSNTFDPDVNSVNTRRAIKKGVVGPSAISLFSGGGGLDVGFHQAGYRTLACIEIDEEACRTLTANRDRYFPDAVIVNSDVTAVSVKDLMRDCGLKAGELDILYGGPPCQSFSQIGKKENLNDIRGKLLFSVVDYARILKPKTVLIENVKALSMAPDLNGVRGGGSCSVVRGA